MTEQPDVQITPHGMSLIVRGKAVDGVLTGCIGLQVVKVVGKEVMLELAIADPENGEPIAFYGQYPMVVGGEPLILSDWGASLTIEITDSKAPPEDPGLLYLQGGDNNAGREDAEGALSNED